MNNPIDIGPMPGETMISGALDYYKPTMNQLQFVHEPETQVTFRLNNRSDENLLKYVDPEQLALRLARYQPGWQTDETEALSHHERRDGEPLFSQDYLDFLATSILPEIDVSSTNDLTVQSTGDWPLVSLWETVVMQEINETYFDAYVRQNNLDVEELYIEGDKRLSDKITTLQSRPDIKFADFGTRRRFSYRWHRHVLQRLVAECPENLIGTSNVQMAEEFGLMPIGTYAHELPMVYAALSDEKIDDPYATQSQLLDDWHELYDNNLSTALPDTFGSELFFSDFTPEQANQWAGIRHDSGDPVDFANNLIAFYENLGIDPLTKTVVFSDGLNLDEIVSLQDTFADKIQVVFGWGTDLTNDLGLPALKIVMKAVQVNNTETVKLSDDSGKHTGNKLDIERYKNAISTKSIPLYKQQERI